MTFGRWLLVHSFSIFLVVLFILGYIYREELQLQQAYQQLLSQPSRIDSTQQGIPEDHQAADTGAETAPTDQAASTPALQAQPEPEEKLPPQSDMDFMETTPTVSQTIINLDEHLLKARKAYWDKDYDQAIRLYQQLIKDDATNPDYIGELGNIYYSINDYDTAAQHYYRAALILMDQGKREQAMLLVSPISAMNRDLGDQLKRKLSQR